MIFDDGYSALTNPIAANVVNAWLRYVSEKPINGGSLLGDHFPDACGKIGIKGIVFGMACRFAKIIAP